MSKRIIRYEDTQKIISGKNTVVYGQQSLRYNQVIEDAFEAVRATLDGVVEKGIAKCNPADEYIETQGKEIASKRAERAGNRELKKLLLTAIDRQDRLLSYLNRAVADLDSKFEELKLADSSSPKSPVAEAADDKERNELFADMHPEEPRKLDAIISGAKPIDGKSMNNKNNI